MSTTLKPFHSGQKRGAFDVLLAALASYPASKVRLARQAGDASETVTRNRERLELHRNTRWPLETIVALPQQHAADDQNNEVIARIEGIFETILDNLLEEDAAELSLPYRSRRARSLEDHAAASQTTEPGRLRFPGKAPSEAKKFGRFCEAVASSLMSFLIASRLTYRGKFLACLLCILRVSHEALVSSNIITKRFVLLYLPRAKIRAGS